MFCFTVTNSEYILTMKMDQNMDMVEEVISMRVDGMLYLLSRYFFLLLVSLTIWLLMALQLVSYCSGGARRGRNGSLLFNKYYNAVINVLFCR